MSSVLDGLRSSPAACPMRDHTQPQLLTTPGIGTGSGKGETRKDKLQLSFTMILSESEVMRAYDPCLACTTTGYMGTCRCPWTSSPNLGNLLAFRCTDDLYSITLFVRATVIVAGEDEYSFVSILIIDDFLDLIYFKLNNQIP